MPVNIYKNNNNQYFTEDGNNRTYVTPVNTTLGDESQWTYRDENGQIYEPNQMPVGKNEQLSQGTDMTYADKKWVEEHPIQNQVHNYLQSLHNFNDALSDYFPGIGMGMGASAALHGESDKAADYVHRNFLPTALTVAPVSAPLGTAATTAALTHAGASMALHGMNEDNKREAGWALFPGALGRTMALTGATYSGLTGKPLTGWFSSRFVKPYVNKYLGTAYYKNIRPAAYGNAEPEAAPRKQQIAGLLRDFVLPQTTFGPSSVYDGNYTPNWYINKHDPTFFERVRDDAHRLSMELPPHEEILPDGTKHGTPHTLYKKQPDGTYDVDWNYRNFVFDNYKDGPEAINQMGYLPKDGPARLYYYEEDPLNGSVVGNDKITGNGGFSGYYPDPTTTFNMENKFPRFGKGLRVSTGDTYMIDDWDVQPLKDSRSFAPKITEFAKKLQSKYPNSWLGKLGYNIQNMELVQTFGGTPFRQKSKLPQKPIWWYKSNNIETLINNHKKDGTVRMEYLGDIR